VLTGTAPLDELTTHCATLDGFDTEPVTLPGAEVFQALFEMRIGGRQASLPPGLHPTNPPTFVFQFWHCPDSPWGPFRLAQGRVGCRSGLRPRGFVQGCVCDNTDAIDALARRWGFPAREGSVTLERGYDAVGVSAVIGGTAVAVLTALDPEPLGVDDVAYTTTTALAHTPKGLRLVQIDADVAVARAERVRPRLDAFAAAPWVHPSVVPYHPVSASIAIADLTLNRLRFVSKPDELAFSGTETVGAG
jgi:hypothetical protein